MNTVLVAGATGYLGRNIVNRYMAKGWHVRALVRSAAAARASGVHASEIVEAEATKPDTLADIMAGVDLVVSALGITRQRDGLSYWEVDFQANDNLLEIALKAGVEHFAYVHILNADAMVGVPMIDAKQAFADKLQASAIRSTIICPSGFFSDMADFYAMSKAGRVWLFGDGSHRINPIEGADLSAAAEEAISKGQDVAEIGGPDALTHREIAELAFEAQEKPVKITYLPDILRRVAIRILAYITPGHVHGPALMFLRAMGMDMVGQTHGNIHLRDHFIKLARQEALAEIDQAMAKENVKNAH